MSVGHYENFPVASFLLPAPLREPIAAIYQFARTADDFADEGDHRPEQRRAWLQAYHDELDAVAAGRETMHPVFIRLRPVITRHRLPLNLFHDLVDAFIQDIEQDRYASRNELMDYCRRSANPVGRLLLHVFKHDSPDNLLLSDAICTSLQLINHWQDVAIDLRKGPRGRIYLPATDLARFAVTEAQLHAARCDAGFRALLAHQVTEARTLMLSGAPLGRRLPGRIGLEIRAIVAGGLRILEKIEAVDYDVFRRRPVLTAPDWPRILLKAL